jgi:hypothetical protein
MDHAAAHDLDPAEPLQTGQPFAPQMKQETSTSALAP